MKKVLALLIAVLLCFSLIACTSEAPETKDEKKETKQTTAANDDPTAEGDDEEVIADEPETDEPEADEPEVDEPEVDGIIGEWVAYIDTEDSLAALGMDSADLEAQYGVTDIEEILDGVSLPVYMTITEDSIERAMYAEDILDFMTDMYDSLFGYMADYDVATEMSGEDQETLDAQAQAEGYEDWPDMCNGMTDFIIAQFEESGTFEDFVTEDPYEFDGEEIVCGYDNFTLYTFTFDGEFIVTESEGTTLTYERV